MVLHDIGGSTARFDKFGPWHRTAVGTVVHQLITRGTDVRFQWVPAQVCLSGNEMADRAAKRGARRLEP